MLSLQLKLCRYISGIILLYGLFKVFQVFITWIYKKRNKKQFRFKCVFKRVCTDVFYALKRFVIIAFILIVFILLMPSNNKLESPSALLLLQEDAGDWQELEGKISPRIYSFANIDEQDKLKLMQDIVNYEMSYLGVDYEVNLILTERNEEGWSGSYKYISREIYIDKSLLEEDVETVLAVIFHECYHAYQLYCVDIYEKMQATDYSLRMNKQILVWRYENSNYKTVNANGYEGYSNQSIERDARGYAKCELDRFIELLEKD